MREVENMPFCRHSILLVQEIGQKNSESRLKSAFSRPCDKEIVILRVPVNTHWKAP